MMSRNSQGNMSVKAGSRKLLLISGTYPKNINNNLN